MSTPSHRLKLYRADDHLVELEAMIEPLRQRREYPVSETVERERKRFPWTYRLELGSVEMPENFPVVLGDYLFNIRSALDHLVVAIAPRKHRYRVGFPIFTTDPLARDETSGDYLKPDDARLWNAMTTGLPNDCVTRLAALQPHHIASLHGQPAERHPLAILSALQNRDKHRELVPAVTGLSQTQITYNGEAQGVVPVLKNRAVVARETRPMDVKAEGTAVIGLGGRNPVWPYDAFVEKLVTFIAREALPRLEQFLK